jgi:hypothetical protein
MFKWAPLSNVVKYQLCAVLAGIGTVINFDAAKSIETCVLGTSRMLVVH